MGKERTAVIGVGQTKYASTRGDVSMAGLLREAAYRALDMAGKTWDEIDAVIMGKAPDFFEGVMMPEIYLSEALGCTGKPIMLTNSDITELVAFRRRLHRRPELSGEEE